MQQKLCWKTRLSKYYMLWNSKKSENIGKLLIIFNLLVTDGLSTSEFSKLRICEDDALQYAEEIIYNLLN